MPAGAWPPAVRGQAVSGGAGIWRDDLRDRCQVRVGAPGLGAVDYRKYDGSPHRAYPALRLGEDEHGTWLGVPGGDFIEARRRPASSTPTRTSCSCRGTRGGPRCSTRRRGGPRSIATSPRRRRGPTTECSSSIWISTSVGGARPEGSSCSTRTSSRSTRLRYGYPPEVVKQAVGGGPLSARRAAGEAPSRSRAGTTGLAGPGASTATRARRPQLDIKSTGRSPPGPRRRTSGLRARLRDDRTMTLRDAICAVPPARRIWLVDRPRRHARATRASRVSRKAWARAQLAEIGDRSRVLQEQLFATAKVRVTGAAGCCWCCRRWTAAARTARSRRWPAR